MMTPSAFITIFTQNRLRVVYFLETDLALVGPTGVQLLIFFCFSISVISCCRILNVVSSLYSFAFYVLGDVTLVS